MKRLPSAIAAEKFWRGEPGAGWTIAGSMLERSAIVATALYLAGERKRLLRYTVAVTVAIEVVVLAVLKPENDS